MFAATRLRPIPLAPSPRVLHHARGAALLPFAAWLVACGGDSTSSGGGRSDMTSVDAATPAGASAPAIAPAPAPEYRTGNALGDQSEKASSLGMIGAATVQSRDAAAPSQPASSAVAPPALPATARSAPAAPAMVIRSGQASVQVDTLARAIASIQRITASLGGYVGNTAIALGEDQVRRATIELKIPVSRYDDAVAGLTPLGKVESVNSSAEDVGEEFTDLSARITNAHKLEARLIDLLAERTGKLQDALMVERELARVREEIERYEGRIRFLGARVAMSTLTVNLHEAIPLVSQNPSENVLVEAAKDAWRNFVSLLAFVISALGVVLPVGALGAATYALYRRRLANNPASIRAVSPRAKPDATT